MYTDQKVVSKMFNNYYINVAGNLEKKIPKPKTKFQDYLKNPNEHSIYLKETTPAEVNKLTCDLDANKAPDLYGISAKIVKMGGYIMDSIISYLFNMSINHGKFPNFLQNAKVIPVHKDDSRLEIIVGRGVGPSPRGKPLLSPRTLGEEPQIVGPSPGGKTCELTQVPG